MCIRDRAMAEPKSFEFFWNLAVSISYGNILGAFTTILVNNPLGSLSSSLEITAQSALSLKQARAAALVGAARAWAKSFGEGVVMMRELWSTGENFQKVSQFDSALVNNPVELIGRMADDPAFPKQLRTAAKASAQYKWVMRSMMAADAVIRWPAREAIRFVQSAAIAKDRMKPGQSLADAVDELNYPGGRAVAVAEAQKQAADELASGVLKTKLDARLRTIELIQSKLSPEGATVAEESDELANYGSLLNDQPADLIGVMANALMRLANPGKQAGSLEKVVGGATQPFIRFVRTSANGTRLLADYALGYGAFRYWMRNAPLMGAEAHGGVNLMEGPSGDRLTQVRLQRFYVGMMLYAGIAAILAATEDDDDPFIDFYGAGPTTPDERARLRDSKVRLNSIKVGDTYIPVNVGPLQPLSGILGAAGRYRDNKRWPKGESETGDKEPELAGIAAAKGIGNAIANQSFARALTDLLLILQGNETAYGQSASEFLAKNAAQFIPGNARGFSQLDEIVNGTREKAEGFWDTTRNAIAFFTPTGRAVTLLGDEVTDGRSLLLRAVERVLQVTTISRDAALLFVTNNGLSVPDRQRKADGNLQTYSEYNDYMRKSGKRLRGLLEQGLQGQLQAIPEEGVSDSGKKTFPRRAALNDVWRDVRNGVLEAGR